ncbi:DUF3137 domain-containing protein [Amorphus orientalis]|uniref:DUF3137 domain-containing protein n=1 Tax=Amorphus orientalis TaxID=649198 RepID=A0AAE4ATI1_9HYPH|nr:DUF3137 domain-containing protein [Amorphus orientalis]MDQ0315014.1 hypothetical protein [Amorphus orientalis]
MKSVASREETGFDRADFGAYYEAEIAPDLAQIEGRRKLMAFGVRALWGLSGVGLLLFLSAGMLAPSLGMDRDTLGFAGGALLFGGIGGAILLGKLARAPFKRILVGRTCAFFGLDYKTKGFDFPIDAFRDAEILPRFDKHRLRDGISGRHRGVDIQICEAVLTRVRDNSRGNSIDRKSEEAFDGLLLAYGFAEPFSGDTVVLSDMTWLGNKLKGLTQSGERVTLEDPEFERQFEVYSDDQVEARYLLQPRFMERLVSLAGRLNAGKRMSLAFRGNRLLVALRTDADFFEGGAVGKDATDRERAEELLREIQMIFNVVDVLDLGERRTGGEGGKGDGTRAGGISAAFAGG